MPIKVEFDGAKLLAANMTHERSKNDDEAIEIVPPGEKQAVTVRRDRVDGHLLLVVERSAAHRAIAAALGVGKLEREKAVAAIEAPALDVAIVDEKP